MTNVAEKLTTIADNIPKVYDAGKRAGADGSVAFEEGKKAARLDWWAKYINLQPNGIGYVYSGNNLFSGPGWTDDTFDLPYPIQELKRVDEMFKASGRIDLKGKLGDKLFIKLDNCTNFQNMFYYSGVYNIPTLNCSKAANMRSMFDSNSQVTNIDEIILPTVTTDFANMFNNCSALRSIRFRGTISQNGINLQWSKSLDKDSITSLVEALSKSTSGLTVTLSKDAVDEAFSTSGTAGSATTVWNNLRTSKSNWTISLV